MESVSLLQEGKMVWMPEIGLGIGCESGTRGHWEREWVYWYDRNCVRYPTAEERAEQAELEKQQAELEKQQAEAIALQAEQRAERLAEMLRNLGIDPLSDRSTN